MTQTQPWTRPRFERFALALLFGLIGAMIANLLAAMGADAFHLVGKPYDPGSLIFGMIVMLPIGILAAWSGRPGRWGAAGAIGLACFYGWFARDILLS